jgi:hypothetical protein
MGILVKLKNIKQAARSMNNDPSKWKSIQATQVTAAVRTGFTDRNGIAQNHTAEAANGAVYFRSHTSSWGYNDYFLFTDEAFRNEE